jgi:hypothetical protein
MSPNKTSTSTTRLRKLPTKEDRTIAEIRRRLSKAGLPAGAHRLHENVLEPSGAAFPFGTLDELDPLAARQDRDAVRELLDPLGLTEMRELILKLNGQGKTILFSSHIIAEVEKLAHRVAILSGGERVQLIERSEWEGCPGRLEDIFVETVRSRGETGLG